MVCGRWSKEDWAVRGFGTLKITTEVFLENQVFDGVILERGSEGTSWSSLIHSLNLVVQILFLSFTGTFLYDTKHCYFSFLDGNPFKSYLSFLCFDFLFKNKEQYALLDLRNPAASESVVHELAA